MKLAAIALSVMLAFVAPAIAANQYVISYDMGGLIGQYIQKYNALIDAGDYVKIDGPCVSACAFVVAMPRDHVCVTPKASIGFHGAFAMKPNENGEFVPTQVDENGDPVIDEDTTLEIEHVYPQDIQDWIESHGGMQHYSVTYLQGKDLQVFFRLCDSEPTVIAAGK